MKHMLEHHEHNQALATLLVCPLEGVGTKIPGVWIDGGGRVLGFGKNSPAAGARCLHYASYMFFSDELWALLPEGSSNILYDVLEPALKKGAKVLAYRADELLWFETGNVADYLKATETCLNHLKDSSPYGTCLTDILDHVGPTFRLQSDLSQRLLIADSAEIGGGVDVSGYAVIGERCQIGRGARLRDCVLLSDYKVTDGTSVTEEVL